MNCDLVFAQMKGKVHIVHRYYYKIGTRQIHSIHSVNTTLGMVSLTSLTSVSVRRVNTMDNASYVNIYFMQA